VRGPALALSFSLTPSFIPLRISQLILFRFLRRRGLRSYVLPVMSIYHMTTQSPDANVDRLFNPHNIKISPLFKLLFIQVGI
jgi:hypothetical protein